jgi:thiol:disulfide interchange protein DsbD
MIGMKKAWLLMLVALLVTVGAMAQIKDPVQWSYSAKKKADKVYEVVISARLPKPWHIYSQTTPDGGPVPTKITFKANPLVTTEGKVKEVGALKVEHDQSFGVDVKSYYDKVDFVQTVKLKGNVKTNIVAAVEYMVCDDSQCLPPTTKSFDIKLQ